MHSKKISIETTHVKFYQSFIRQSSNQPGFKPQILIHSIYCLRDLHIGNCRDALSVAMGLLIYIQVRVIVFLRRYFKCPITLLIQIFITHMLWCTDSRIFCSFNLILKSQVKIVGAVRCNARNLYYIKYICTKK